jgi:hypothetical protein
MKTSEFMRTVIACATLALWATVVPVSINSASAATIVDIATDATDTSNLADTEPSIAVNPMSSLEIAVVTFSESWGPNVMAPVWKTSDGGNTWRKVFQIPQPTVPSPVPGQPPMGLPGPGDQKIAFDAAGNLFIAELGIGSPIRDFVYRQTGAADGPLTPGAAYGDDQPHIDVHQAPPGQACAGVLYSPWLNFGVASGPQSTVSWSNTSGTAMNDVPAGDISSFPNRTTRIALASDGRAYVVYKTREGMVSGVSLPGSTNNDFENVHFRVQRSDDCGSSWNALGGAVGISVHGNNTVQTYFTNNFGVTGAGRKVARARSSDAWITANPTNGHVYVAYVRRDASTFGQIYVARSTDNGLHWNSTRVTDGSHHCAFPEIAVAGNGTIGVMYVDFDDTGTNTNFRHHFARSFNNGVTWTDQILQSMDPSPLANAASGFLWGDYEGLTVAGHAFYGVFTGESIGRTTPQLDPIFFTETADLSIHPKFPYLYRLCSIVGCPPFKTPWEWNVDPAPDERFRILVRAGGPKASALKAIQNQTRSLTLEMKNASSKQRMKIEDSAKRHLAEIKKIGY